MSKKSNGLELAPPPQVRRVRAAEWIITFNVGQWLMRCWVEADPDYGGIASVSTAMETIQGATVGATGPGPQMICDYMMVRVPALRSIEVCDKFGMGVRIYRP